MWRARSSRGELDKSPSAHAFYESHVPWLEVKDDLPKKVSPQAADARVPGGKRP